ncbi:uncharacterized protein LOC121536373 [Coregonus clupeaformis]|uniref:uncharacterized protein LOC121536373 n=1 Tax=Coregonus clupeaformis TaxID=59861 RepID=UPI001E1C9A19|nr:uncharacterized protein LOC121536373 [Coregonus clupeaformis]
MASDDIWKVCELDTTLRPLGKRGNITKTHASTPLSTDEKVINTPPRSDSTTAEFIEVHALDGRAITIVSTRTQTDWEWVEQTLTDSCQVQSEVERFEPKASSQTALQCEVIGPDSENEEPDEEKEDESHGIPNVGPPSLLAYKPESKQPPVHFEKIPVVSSSGSSQSKRETDFVLCDYCQQPCNPFIRREQLENNRDLELLFCCERAQKMREFLLEEERALAAVEVNRKIDVGPHPPFMNKHEKRAAKERAEQRLREWELQKVLLNTGNQNRFFSGQIKTISYRLSNEVWTIQEESRFPQMDVMDSSDIFTLQGEMDRQHRERVGFCINIFTLQGEMDRQHRERVGFCINIFTLQGEMDRQHRERVGFCINIFTLQGEMDRQHRERVGFCINIFTLQGEMDRQHRERVGFCINIFTLQGEMDRQHRERVGFCINIFTLQGEMDRQHRERVGFCINIFTLQGEMDRQHRERVGFCINTIPVMSLTPTYLI